MVYYKNYFVPVIILFLVFFCGSFVSCKDEQEYNYFLIPVDSISVPEIVTRNEPFVVDFFGTVGNNGCYSFHQFNLDEQEREILVEAWGKLSLNSQLYPTIIVLLDGKSLIHTFEEAGNYTLAVKQPDGTLLERMIKVE